MIYVLVFSKLKVVRASERSVATSATAQRAPCLLSSRAVVRPMATGGAAACQFAHRGGAGEGHRGDGAARDPLATFANIKRRGVGLVGLHLGDGGAELPKSRGNGRQRARARGVQHPPVLKLAVRRPAGRELGDQGGGTALVRHEIDRPSTPLQHLRGRLTDRRHAQSRRRRRQALEHGGNRMAAGKHHPIEGADVRQRGT
jgi:hypothetical protein